MKIQKRYSISLKKFVDFNKQQKGKGIKILPPKKILQRLAIAHAKRKQVIYPKNLIKERKHGEKIDDSSVRIFVNKIENRIMFKIETGYYL